MKGMKKAFVGLKGKAVLDSSEAVCKIMSWDSTIEDATRVETWFHLSILEWSPGNVGFRSLRYVGTNALANDVLRGLDDYTCLWDFIEGLNMAWSATVNFYQLHISDRPIPVLDGRTVEVFHVGDELTILPKGKRKPRGATVETKAAWRRELDGLSESSSDNAPPGGDGDDIYVGPVDEDGDPLYPLGTLHDGRPPSSIDGGGTSVVGASSREDEGSGSGSDATECSRAPIPWVDSDPEALGIFHDSPERGDDPPVPPKTPSGGGDSSSSSSSSDGSKSSGRSSSGPPSRGPPSPGLPPAVAPDPPPLDEVREVFMREREVGRQTRDGVVLRNGFIVYDALEDKFIAYCVGLHGNRCCKSRAAHARKPKWEIKPAQGRPLGFLGAWLFANWLSHAKHDHSHEDWFSLEDREGARLEMHRDAEAEEWLIMLGHERPQRDGEPPEPVDCP